MDFARPARSRWTYRILAVIWMTTIFWLSSKQSLPSQGLFPGQDKIEHALAFGTLGLLIAGSFRGWGGRLSTRQIIVVILITACYGLFDEGHQYFVPGRDSSLGDVGADIVGGFLAALVFRRRRADILK
ncbi:MAG: VanZ family protein [Desulfatiglandaceae bacterium]